MKKRLLGLTLLLLGMLAVPREAAADVPFDASFVDAVLATVGFGVLDLGLTTIDVASSEHGKQLPRFYGGVETLAAGAQFAVCLDNALSTYSGGAAGWWMGAGIGALFVVHGIVTLVGPLSHAEAPPPPPPVVVAPLALSDVTRAAVPGLAVLGRF